LVSKGSVVVTIDLRGQGETASSGRSPDGSGRSPDRAGNDALTADSNLASLLGRPLLGLHVEDTLAAGHFVAYYQTDKPRDVHLIGVGQSGLTALHAAALRPDLFTSVTLHNTPREWSSLIHEAAPGQQLTGIVPGALTAYDLPDLVELIGAERVKWE
jgi:pimeloyl-ACP methyl ester carboxylesterase